VNHSELRAVLARDSSAVTSRLAPKVESLLLRRASRRQVESPVRNANSTTMVIWEDHVPDKGRAVAQAFSCWLPTAAAWVRVRAACGVCGGQSGTEAGFLRVLRFPLPIIPPISTSS
jgi:hypothetical protein